MPKCNTADPPIPPHVVDRCRREVFDLIRESPVLQSKEDIDAFAGFWKVWGRTPTAVEFAELKRDGVNA